MMTSTAMTSTNKIAIILAAAGSSTRMGPSCKKEFLPLESGTVLSTAAKAFLSSGRCQIINVIIPQGMENQAKQALFCDNDFNQLLQQTNGILIFTTGGKSRQESVYKGLIALQDYKPDIVLIHDGARPFVTESIIQQTVNAAIQFGASVSGIQPVDTQKLIDENGFISQHLQRKMMTAVQTPQGFDYIRLLKAHKKALLDNREYTDDTEIWGNYAGKIKVVDGDVSNIKITYKEDYKKNSQMTQIKTGLGYDIHKLQEGRKLIIGGIEIPSQKGELGHSDGDALLHAITDALLGASCLGDIGSFFPPEEIKWKDADSAELLKTVWKKVKSAGYHLGNLDCVIKLEQPKFLPFRELVRKNIAAILGVTLEQIFVKAKTGEKMDSVGQGNAIETWVSCLLFK